MTQDTSNQEIIGLNLETDEQIRLQLQFIRKEWLEIDLSLYTGKWFDYRYLTPVQATYLFAHEFQKAYRLAYRSNVDGAKAPFVRHFKDGDLFKADKKVISAMWRARQVADALGVPYDLYLNRAIYWRLRFWNRRYLPQPMHLYSDLVTDRVAEDWAQFQTQKLYLATAPQYHNQNYRGMNFQNDHHEWLFKQAELRNNSPRFLAELTFERQVLPAEKVLGRFGPEHYQRILQRGQSAPI